MSETDIRDHVDDADAAKRAADLNNAMQELAESDQVIEQLTVDIGTDAEVALDDLVRQINDLGEDCPAELRTARLEAEDALAEVRQTLSDASKTITSLSKHLKSLS